MKRRLRHELALYFGIVQDQMCDSVHLFRGLKRPLKWADDMDGDKHALAFAWRPSADFVFMGPEEGGLAVPRLPQNGVVLVVLVMPEMKPSGSNGVYGTVEHWSWLRESQDLEQAPTEWRERYDQKLWSRGIE